MASVEPMPSTKSRTTCSSGFAFSLPFSVSVGVPWPLLGGPSGGAGVTGSVPGSRGSSGSTRGSAPGRFGPNAAVGSGIVACFASAS